MIKLLLIPLIIFAAPSGIAAAVLLWRRGKLSLKKRELELEAMKQEQLDKYWK